MRTATIRPLAMTTRIVVNPIVRLWNRSLVFRLLTLPVVIPCALLLSFALRKTDNHDLRNSKPTA